MLVGHAGQQAFAGLLKARREQDIGQAATPMGLLASGVDLGGECRR
jgi:hypothetical protein